MSYKSGSYTISTQEEPIQTKSITQNGTLLDSIVSTQDGILCGSIYTTLSSPAEATMSIYTSFQGESFYVASKECVLAETFSYAIPVRLGTIVNIYIISTSSVTKGTHSWYFVTQ